MTLRAIVFDFDGVLANSEPLHYRAYRDVLADEGIALSEADYYTRYLGFDDVGAFQAIASDRALPMPRARVADLIGRKAARLEALERDRSVLFPEAGAIVRAMAAALPLAIASGARGEEIRRVLDREMLMPCFQTIVAAEDTRLSKPAPDPYRLAVEQLSSIIGEPIAPSQCVAVEDSVWGLESARAAGLRTVAVAQTYPKDALRGADLVIASIGELNLPALTRLFSD